MKLNKVIIISGPTATGKTSVAAALAKEFNGVLVSADSRQIYRGLDIGTGKDHPPEVDIKLIDILTPDQTFSVAQFQKLAQIEINRIWQQGRLPIVIGGTFQYIDSLINPNTQTFSIKPNKYIRFVLNKLSLGLLQRIYKAIDNKSYSSLNNSDVHNPRRLIRKIEITLMSGLVSASTANEIPSDVSILHLSLTAANSELYSRIDVRVDDRLDSGLLKEIETLLKNYSWSDPGLNTLAYKEFKPYFKQPDPETLAVCVKTWKYDEHAFARRQKTWLKKRPGIKSVDITLPGFKNIIHKTVVHFLKQP